MINDFYEELKSSREKDIGNSKIKKKCNDDAAHKKIIPIIF